MHNIGIIPSTLDHVNQMGLVMNDEDRAEHEAVGVKAHRSLWRGYKNSLIRNTIMIDEEVAAMYGVCGSLMGNIGIVWLVTGKKAREISPHRFARIYKQEVAKMLEVYPILCNYVDDRYIGAKKMLRIAGFNVGEPMPLGKFKHMFCKFSKEA